MRARDDRDPCTKGLDRREFTRLLAGSAAAASLSFPVASCGTGGSSMGRRVVMLGLDGLEPKIVKALMEMGRLPNMARLAAIGAFMPLGTSMPALSPVAWSSIITGTSPGDHGVSDFFVRDPATYTPKFSLCEATEADIVLDLGNFHLPIKGGDLCKLRRGRPFWSYLAERGIPTILTKTPTDFPPDEKTTYEIAGLGTPDIIGGYGTYSYFTTDPFERFPSSEGGIVSYVEVRDNTVRGEILGPPNSLHTTTVDGAPTPRVTRAPWVAYLDPDNDVVRIDVQGTSLVLNPGEYSEWVRLELELLPLVAKVSGIVRFLVKEVRPHFKLYVTPINIDPEHQVFPITHPESLGAEIARDIGPFWTKGLPSDMKALNHGVLSDEEYVKQAELILEERLALFEHMWSRFHDGLFFFYVSSTDQDAHMLWRIMDPSHPQHQRSDLRFSGFLHYLYERMDELIGRVLPAVDDSTLLLICSDHGFAPYSRRFHLNTWLRDHGYLGVVAGAEKADETTYLQVDWPRTAVYGMGFNGLYLNRKGREGQGIVEAEKAPELVERLCRELEEIVDPETGLHPIHRVYRREEVCPGQLAGDLPELLVGYSEGYRCSSNSVLGGAGAMTIDPNPWAWSGDHSIAAELVPGVLLSSRPIARTSACILDLPVTVLDFFGIDRPPQMGGRSLLRT